MKIRRTMQWLALGLVVPLLGGATEAATPDAAGGSAAKCTITIKARLDPGALGKDAVTLLLGVPASANGGGGSRVRIKSGTWSRLGDSPYRVVSFSSDGSWSEREDVEVSRTRAYSKSREGTGQWSGQVQLNMGCRYNRRYEFRIARVRGLTTSADVHPQYPSTSTWTRSQTIDLGNLARYF